MNCLDRGMKSFVFIVRDIGRIEEECLRSAENEAPPVRRSGQSMTSSRSDNGF